MSLEPNFYAAFSVLRDGEFQTVSCKCEKQSEIHSNIRNIEDSHILYFPVSMSLCCNMCLGNPVGLLNWKIETHSNEIIAGRGPSKLKAKQKKRNSILFRRDKDTERWYIQVNGHHEVNGLQVKLNTNLSIEKDQGNWKTQKITAQKRTWNVMLW